MTFRFQDLSSVDVYITPQLNIMYITTKRHTLLGAFQYSLLLILSSFWWLVAEDRGRSGNVMILSMDDLEDSHGKDVLVLKGALNVASYVLGDGLTFQ